MDVSIPILLSWIAAALGLISFFLKTMIPLRAVAMLADVVYLLYGFHVGAVPTLVLHGLLLPLNGLRLVQMRSLTFKVRSAANGKLSLSMLLPYMKHRRLAAGAVFFNRGDAAQEVFYIISGAVRLVELDRVLGPGELLGEMGIFTDDAKRTGTAVCVGEVEFGSISADKFWELFFQDPAFGSYLVRTIVKRAASNTEWVNHTLESRTGLA